MKSLDSELSDFDNAKGQFESEAELIAFLSQYSSGGSGTVMYSARGGDMMEMAVDSVAMPKMAMASNDMAMDESGSSGWDGGSQFSETNVQVKGIDEADIIKTDGKYIYTVSDKTLYIVDAYPGDDAEVISTVSFDYAPTGLFINNDVLTVFGNVWDYDLYPKYNSGTTFVEMYDLSDKANLEKTKDFAFEGSYFRGRMKGDYMYVITSTYPDSSRPMPLFMENGIEKSIAIDDIYFFPTPYDNPMYVNVHAIKADGSLTSKSMLVEGNREMYMSHDSMYFTYTDYESEWEIEEQLTIEMSEQFLSEDDQKLISAIKVVDNAILSSSEKKYKIQDVHHRALSRLSADEQETFRDNVESALMKKLDEIEYFEHTIINKVDYSKGIITPVSNGKVPGSINNQFSLDEQDGILRLATTVNGRWSRFDKDRSESENHVYTLDQNLDVLDSVTDIAQGERIYSTRFMGDKLYMVTFEQVDPFFVIDLEDAQNIKILGELKIPGFSRYLHPYDENTIIGIGQDATETGRTKGLKISLFDVTDVSNPTEVAQYVTEERYASSTALYEHKAFLFDREKELLVIPAYSYDYRGDSEDYNGAFVFKLAKDDIELRGLIDHSGQGNKWDAAVERSLYIDELLYTKSPSLLRINALDTLESVKNVTLSAPPKGMKVY